VLRRDQRGSIGLWTHTDRRNPQVATLERESELLLVAYGPDSYFSLAWYLRHPSVPSWNYIAVHVRGKPRPLADDRPELID
jgi:transcriptional regulator